MPRVIALLIFLSHTVSALGTSVPPPPNQPQQACVSLKITTTTAKWSKEQAWRIDDGKPGQELDRQLYGLGRFRMYRVYRGSIMRTAPANQGNLPGHRES